jgi:hypothetical protein
MDYQTFTNSSLTLMYETVRGALASDDAQEGQGRDPSFGVRDTGGWKKHAAYLEAEMLRRGILAIGNSALGRCRVPGDRSTSSETRSIIRPLAVYDLAAHAQSE